MIDNKTISAIDALIDEEKVNSGEAVICLFFGKDGDDVIKCGGISEIIAALITEAGRTIVNADLEPKPALEIIKACKEQLSKMYLDSVIKSKSKTEALMKELISGIEED